VALWSFAPPSDTTYPFESRPILSIWTRLSVKAGSTVVQNPDGTWTQYDRIAPQTAVDAASKYFFGPAGFSGMTAGATGSTVATLYGSVSSGRMGFATPIRCYLGGHTYVIDDLLKAELSSAATVQHPSGYGAFIFAAPARATFTGDEIIASGYTAVNKFGATPWSNWNYFYGMAWSQLSNTYWSELGDASVEVGR
jgi:hypothetical protein